MAKITYPDRKRVHNLKCYTWVEQQGKTYEEIQAQWYQEDYWTGFQTQIDQLDELIEKFNDRVGLRKQPPLNTPERVFILIDINQTIEFGV